MSRLGLAMVTTLAAALGLLVAAEEATHLTLSRFVGTYRDVETDLGQLTTGPLTFDLSSPSNELRVHRNLVALRPRGDGTVDAELELEVEGWGVLTAVGAGNQRLADRVIAPRQTLALTGRLAIERSAEGFVITYLGGPANLPMAIESDLGEQLLAACAGFAALPFLAIDCGALGSSLRTVDLPLPEDGQRFELGTAHLTMDEAALLSRHLRAP